jgi:hypothetical protein
MGRRMVLRRPRRRTRDGEWIRIEVLRGRWVEACRLDMYRGMGSKDIRLGIRRLDVDNINSLTRRNTQILETHILQVIRLLGAVSNLRCMDIRMVIRLLVADNRILRRDTDIRLAIRLWGAVAGSILCRLVIRLVIGLLVAGKHLLATAIHPVIPLSGADKHLQAIQGAIHPAIPLSIAAGPQAAHHQATTHTHTTRRLRGFNRPRLKIPELDLVVEC